MIALWPSAGKKLTSWLSGHAVLLNAVLVVCVPFPFGVWDGCGFRLYRFLVIAFSSTFTFELPRGKTNKMTVRPAKTQISLGIRPV